MIPVSWIPFLLVGAQITVISHRGEHLAHPENTLPAFQAAIDAGADFFELDVRTTSDGHLVLMHDGTVDRTTNGTGRVRDLTFDQIRALDAGAKFGSAFAGTKVPTFEEALNLAHGKIGVYVDSKDLTPASLVAALEKTDMLDKVVIYGGSGFLKGVQAVNPSLKVMPEADNAETLRKLLAGLKLQVVAFDAGDFKDDVIAVAKQAHVDMYVDRLWTADQVPMWQDAIDRGAAGIQTDKPAELVQYLRSHGLHQ
jgi:glycerophosphoryl diester phosphodiesterase